MKESFPKKESGLINEEAELFNEETLYKNKNAVDSATHSEYYEKADKNREQLRTEKGESISRDDYKESEEYQALQNEKQNIDSEVSQRYSEIQKVIDEKKKQEYLEKAFHGEYEKVLIENKELVSFFENTKSDVGRLKGVDTNLKENILSGVKETARHNHNLTGHESLLDMERFSQVILWHDGKEYVKEFLYQQSIPNGKSSEYVQCSFEEWKEKNFEETKIKDVQKIDNKIIVTVTAIPNQRLAKQDLPSADIQFEIESN